MLVAGSGAKARSTRIPAILRPSRRTSLGHLILAWRPVHDETTSAAATAPSAVNQARAEGPGRVARHQVRRWEKHDRHQDRRPRGGRPRPASATPAGGLFLGQDHQAIVGTGGAGPSSQVVGAGDAVPDHDPPPEPAGRQLVLDLIGTEPLGGADVGRASVGMLLDPESKADQGTSDHLRTWSRSGPSSLSGT